MTDPATPVLALSDATTGALKRFAVVVAVIAVAVWVLGRRFGWLEYRPGGASFDTFVTPIFTVIFVIALLVAFRYEFVGGAIAGFAAAASIAFATRQLIASHALLTIALFAIPGIAWLVLATSESSARTAAFGLGATLALSVAGLVVGDRVYAHFWGPTHPESSVEDLPGSPVEWSWTGAVTSTSGEIRVRPRDDHATAMRLALATDEALIDSTWIEPSDDSGRVFAFRLDDLEPDTEYHYAIEVDGALDTVRAGSFSTFADGADSYVVAIGSCARIGSNGAIFDTIRELDPMLYLITGDLHYGDNGVNDIDRFRDVMDLTLRQPAQAALYRSTPIAYVWDDHDYGPNDADGNSPSRQAAMASYREHVPSYELGGAESAVYQAFTVGRVRYILTDARSARNLDRVEEDLPDDAPPSMLGLEQKNWFKSEVVEAAANHELVVWMNGVPWIADEEAGADHWGGFAEERRELADHLVDNEIDNLLMISGDAHMVAIDDGTNTDYSTEGAAGFPLLHAAALDRPGSVKGGPYSHGAIGDGGQFATLEITDDGEAMDVRITGLRWDGSELMSYEFSTR